MANFTFEILTPAKKVCREEVSEVLLPAYDGETGVLPKHGDFVGVLGTGVLKLVRDGDDYWYLVSSGIYQVKDGAVTVFADIAESASEISPEAVEAEIAELTDLLNDPQKFDPQQADNQRKLLKLAQARLEVYRRTSVYN